MAAALCPVPSGQSNMALPVLHTFSRNKSRDAIQSGKAADIRIHGLKGTHYDRPA